MKSLRTGPAVLTTICVIAAAAALWINRVPLGSWFWHLQHNSVIVGAYTVPVPKNWYPQTEDKTSYLLVRLDTDDISPTKRVKAHAGIAIRTVKLPPGDSDINRMAASQASLLEKRTGRSVTTKSVMLGRETLMCVRGDALTVDIVDSPPESWRCNSSGGLQITITATNPDMNQVWDIVSAIRIR